MNFLFKRHKNYVDVSFSSDEKHVGSWTGSAILTGVPVIGITILLTNKRLILAPLNLDPTLKLFDLFSQYINSIEKPLKVVKDTIEYTGAQKVISIPIENIKLVSKRGEPSLSQPPTIEIALKDGSKGLVGVLHNIYSPNFLPANKKARDALFEALYSSIGT